MKRILICSLLAFLFIGLPNAYAYNKKDFYRAIETKKCRQCDLYRASFNGVNLSNADLSGSNLIGANFQNATLLDADLTDANISGANFSGALWLDGEICQAGSYGKCVKKNTE